MLKYYICIAYVNYIKQNITYNWHLFMLDKLHIKYIIYKYI